MDSVNEREIRLTNAARAAYAAAKGRDAATPYEEIEKDLKDVIHKALSESL